MIAGRAVGMAKLELFEPEHARPGAGGPVGDGAAEGAEPDDDEVMVAFHRSALIVPLLPVPDGARPAGWDAPRRELRRARRLGSGEGPAASMRAVRPPTSTEPSGPGRA